MWRRIRNVQFSFVEWKFCCNYLTSLLLRSETRDQISVPRDIAECWRHSWVPVKWRVIPLGSNCEIQEFQMRLLLLTLNGFRLCLFLRYHSCCHTFYYKVADFIKRARYSDFFYTTKENCLDLLIYFAEKVLVLSLYFLSITLLYPNVCRSFWSSPLSVPSSIDIDSMSLPHCLWDQLEIVEREGEADIARSTQNEKLWEEVFEFKA